MRLHQSGMMPQRCDFLAHARLVGCEYLPPVLDERPQLAHPRFNVCNLIWVILCRAPVAYVRLFPPQQRSSELVCAREKLSSAAQEKRDDIRRCAACMPRPRARARACTEHGYTRRAAVHSRDVNAFVAGPLQLKHWPVQQLLVMMPPGLPPGAPPTPC
jgi:hypothetical protein